MKKVALALCKLSKDYQPCDEILASCLANNGFEVSKEYWNDENCHWENYDLVILRSAIDYIDNVDAFLSWVNHVSKVSNLVNGESLIRHNCNKLYLKKLEDRGIEIVPTEVADSKSDLIAVINNLPYDDLVIKAAVGTKGLRTYRFNKDRLSEILETVSSFSINSKCPVLVQPFIASIDEDGVNTAMYFNGKFSFAVKRYPEIDNYDYVKEEHEELYSPSIEEINFCNKVINCYDEVPVYAKIDYIIVNNHPLLLKTGFIEPNLYFNLAPSHAQDLVDAIKQKYA